MLPEEVRNFIKIFSSLPGIGIRQATRLAFRLIGSGKANIEEMAESIAGLQHLKICSRCFFIHKNHEDLCDICRDPKRNQNIVAIVEKETDLISIEKTGKFKGRYLVMGDLAKTGDMETIQKLRLATLKNTAKKSGQFEEIILALNPTTYGDLSAAVIAKELESSTKKITRLGRGIPTGGEIEFADDETLRSALERRS
ncbi:MAG: toprim domain-containing protein [Candidatus Wolfebacteria bacterium]|nr:toprim domain-containing protein [Candidatus Wolfebacteria bacterium]